MNEDKTRPLYFPQLDIIRFFAALMIIVYHAYICWCGWYKIPRLLTVGDYKTLSSIGKPIDQLIHNFPIGVDIFFFISGFLITFLLLKEKRNFGKIKLLNFYIRRSLRIWPLYFFLIAIAPLIVWWMRAESPNYLPNILFLNNFHTISTEQWTFPFSHFWSICIEEHYYILWPLLLTLIPRKHLPLLFVFTFSLSFGFKIYTMLATANSWLPIYMNTLSRMDVIVLGALVAYIHIDHPIRFSISKLATSVLVILIICFLAFDNLSNIDSMYSGVTKRFFYMLLIALSLMNFMFNPNVIIDAKKWNWLLYLGRISYGIYMYGNIIVVIVMVKIMQAYSINNIYLFFILVLTLSILIPIISYEILEKPFLKLKDKFALIKTRL